MTPLVQPNSYLACIATFQRIRRVVLVGAGDVVRKRIWPALQAIAYDFDAIALCSLEPSVVLPGANHSYFNINGGGVLPLKDLARHGFLGDDTLWIIATPSESHVWQVFQLLSADCRGRIAVEKPLTVNHRAARMLMSFAASSANIYQIDHKVFNSSVLAFLDLVREDTSILADIRHIDGVFYESDGFAMGRSQEDGISDIQYHLLTIMIAIFKSLDSRRMIEISEALVTKHTQDDSDRFQLPLVWTASRLKGLLKCNGEPITFDFRQSKAAPQNEKLLRLYGSDGVLKGELDLNESGWQAHARVLEALMQSDVDLRHTLADAVDVVKCVDDARTIARVEAECQFGELPDFLK